MGSPSGSGRAFRPYGWTPPAGARTPHRWLWGLMAELRLELVTLNEFFVGHERGPLLREVLVVVLLVRSACRLSRLVYLRARGAARRLFVLRVTLLKKSALAPWSLTADLVPHEPCAVSQPLKKSALARVGADRKVSCRARRMAEPEPEGAITARADASGEVAQRGIRAAAGPRGSCTSVSRSTTIPSSLSRQTLCVSLLKAQCRTRSQCLGEALPHPHGRGCTYYTRLSD